MDLSPEARMGLCSSRRFGGLVALDEGPSLDLDPTRRLPLPVETPIRLLALPARNEKRTTGLLRVEGGFLLSGKALKLAVVPDPSTSLVEDQPTATQSSRSSALVIGILESNRFLVVAALASMWGVSESKTTSAHLSLASSPCLRPLRAAVR